MRSDSALIMMPTALAEFHAERADLYEHLGGLFAAPPSESALAVLCSVLEVRPRHGHAHIARSILLEAVRTELAAPRSALRDAFRSAAADFEALFLGSSPLVSLSCANPADPGRLEALRWPHATLESSRSSELFDLAKLADQCSRALSIGDRVETEDAYARQARFIEMHARSCLVPFAVEAQAYAGPFYTQVAAALRALIDDDDRHLVRPVLRRLLTADCV
jgi:TorA maturation chaperone TorD